MIRIEIDHFSGLPNPFWEIAEAEALVFLAELTASRQALSTAPGPSRLGFRGLVVHIADDTVAGRYGLPARFRLGDGRAADPDASRALATRLLKAAPHLSGHTARALAELPRIPFLPADPSGNRPSRAPRKGLSGQGPQDEGLLGATGPSDAPADELMTIENGNCLVEVGPFNPDFWNDPDHVTRNNCYAYACNMRTDTFPQPGRYNQLILYETLASACHNSIMDGARTRSACSPANETPRWLVALVTYPDNANPWDYHWYRLQNDGLWCHKPGQTPATSVDNSGHPIVDPQTCDRGPYTVFGGYFYIPISANIS